MPKITYLSHSSWLLEGGGATILFDPFLTGNPKATAKPEDLHPDYILISHGHGDHLGDSVLIAKANNATIVSTYEVATYCGSQGAEAHPMHIGGAHTFPFGTVKLTIAHHGSALESDGSMITFGSPCGFLVTTEDKTLYHAGDTGLFLDMQLIGERHHIDVALLPIGDNFTMGIDDAVKAAQFLAATTVVPMHYGTFDVIDVDPKEFVRRVKAQGQEARVVSIGGSMEF